MNVAAFAGSPLSSQLAPYLVIRPPSGYTTLWRKDGHRPISMNLAASLCEPNLSISDY